MTEVIFISETLPRLLTDTIFNELTAYAIFIIQIEFARAFLWTSGVIGFATINS